MIAFGTAITNLEVYEHCAAPGIRLVAEADSEILPHQTTGSLFRNYNLILDKAAELDDLEALVLLHQDAEIVDPDFCRKLREVLSDPEVAIVGCAGAIGVRSIAWWEGAVTWASFTHRYQELGGGDIDALAWNEDELPAYARTGEVDSIDGFVMALSPWAIRELRFDESLGTLHGYDFDICMQARSKGKKVVTANLRVVHHHSLDLVDDREGWIAAYMRLAEKWDGSTPGPGGGDWKRRALRAEADAAASKGETASALYKLEAYARLLDTMTRSSSWRLTAPLRWPRGALRRRRDR
jgi:hypothetical protein